MASQKSRVQTPCIGICSTTYGDTVCRGCSRFYHEVVNWNGYTEEQKRLVRDRLDEIHELVISKYLVLEHPKVLQWQLRNHAMRFDAQRSPWYWVSLALGLWEQKGLTLEEFGLKKLSTSKALSASALIREIQEEIFNLTQAYYDRQISRAYRHENLLGTQ